MEIVFLFLWIVALIVMVVSIVNPQLAIIPFVKNSRVKAGLIWFGISVVFLILMMVFAGTDNAQARYNNAIQIQAEATPKPTKEIKATKTPKPTKEPTATPKPTNTPILTATPIDIYSMTDEEYVDYVVESIIDDTYAFGSDNYEGVKIESEESICVINVDAGRWLIGGDYWSLAEMYGKKIFGQIYKDGKLEYDYYEIILYREFTDEYGQRYTSKGSEMIMSKEALSKINWDNLLRVRFHEIADEYIEYKK